MQLLHPLAIIVFLPLAAAIIVLYLLKLKRRDFVVPSVFLWRRAVQDVQANAPFQKLRANLLLILQLLALATLITGLAGPYFLARRLGGKSAVIILDASASMKATDVSGSRFAEAKRIAEGIVKGMGRRDEAALLICSDRAELALSFSQDQRRLLAAIRAAQPTDCTTNLRDGLLLAYSLAAKRAQARVYLISDGAVPALPSVASSAELHYLRVGNRMNNVALLALEAARAPGASDQQLFLRLQNYSTERKHCLLSISHEDNLIHVVELDLAPGESRSENYQLAVAKPGLLKAEIEVEDDLTSDNICYTFAGATAALKVLLVTPGNLFLEQALLVQPEVEVFKAVSLSATEAEAAYRDYNLVIFDRVSPPARPTSGAVAIIAATSNFCATLGPEIVSPAITSWEDQHRALRYVNLSAIQIAQGRALNPAPGSVVLARAGDKPIIIANESPGQRALSFGWNFLDSDLPLRVGFPVLVSNMVQWLARPNGRGAATMRVRPGAIVSFPAPAEASRGKLILPDGRAEQVSVADGKLTAPASDQVGVYRLEADGRNWNWAVDLRSPEESDLTPAAELMVGSRQVRAGTGPPKVERHLWPLLASLALLLLLGEWHLYHRRY